MARPVVILGAGGHGRVLLDALLESKIRVLGFLDDGKTQGKLINGFKVLGSTNSISKGMNVALGFGDNRLRGAYYERCTSIGANVISAIHPRAIVSKYVQIGMGVVVMPGSVINANSILEEGVVVNTGATVDHDCYLKRFCQVWPGAHLAGTVEVGEYSCIGTGASVIPNTKIGNHVIVGAGGVVIRNVPNNVTVVGVPANILRKEGKS